MRLIHYITTFLIVMSLTLPLSEARFFDPPHTISILHMHTKEKLTITYKRDGRYDKAALDKLNWLLRDWRRDEPTKIDPRLFDLLWEVTRETGTQYPIHVVSAYRSPQTNEDLRARSRGVAKFSQHTMGRAMDFYLPDVPVSKIRQLAVKKQLGGVGFYPTSGNPFVHLDVGSIRAWPRLTREQLQQIFPDGETVHLPADGKPLEGYHTALQRIGNDGKNGPERVAEYGDQTVRGLVAGSTGGGFFSRSKNLFTALFGGGNEEEDYSEGEPTPAIIPKDKFQDKPNTQQNFAENDAPIAIPQPQKAQLAGDIPVPTPRVATGAPILLASAVPNARQQAVGAPIQIVPPVSPVDNSPNQRGNTVAGIPIPAPRLVWQEGPTAIAQTQKPVIEQNQFQEIAQIAGKPIPKSRPNPQSNVVLARASNNAVIAPIAQPDKTVTTSALAPSLPAAVPAPPQSEQLTWSAGAPPARFTKPNETISTPIKQEASAPSKATLNTQSKKSAKGEFIQNAQSQTANNTSNIKPVVKDPRVFTPTTTFDKTGKSVTTFRMTP